VLDAVPLPAACDTQLLEAAFLSPAARVARSEEPAVARRIAEAVGRDLLCAVHLVALQMRGEPSGRAPSVEMSRASADMTRMDVPHAEIAHEGPSAPPHPAALAAALEQLFKHLRRSAGLLAAAHAPAGDSDADDCSDAEEGVDRAGASVGTPCAPVVVLELLATLTSVVQPIADTLRSSAVPAAHQAALRRAWGKVIVHAIALDAKAAEAILPSVFDVVASTASVDVLVDWQDVLAAMMDAYLPRSVGCVHAAHRILAMLQTIWTLPELQVSAGCRVQGHNLVSAVRSGTWL
jgi:hypothetical protein